MRINGMQFWSVLVLLWVAIMTLHLLSHGEPVMPPHPLAELPMHMGEWSGENLPLEQRIVDFIGVDDYVSRSYSASDEFPIGLYIGYYKTQRTGRTIHSPKNCLPGAGWQPVKAGRIEVPLPNGQDALVNMYIIEKGLDRLAVLYWYQSHGRIIASEYWGKIYLVTDALRLNRTDSALVRITTPELPNDKAAQQRLVAFAQQVIANTQDVSPR